MNSKFYVSYEVEMLLKEKGCNLHKNIPIYNERRDVIGCDPADRLTKAEVIDWLEGKNLTITIDWIRFNEQRRWCYGIFNNETCDWEGSKYEYITRLEAEDAAIIKACEFLENGN